MRDKQFKKFLKEEFEKNNKCPVELSDVLPEENLKNLNDNLYNKYKKQQKLSKCFSLTSLVTVLLLMVSIIAFSIKMGDYHSKLENSPILSDEAREYIIDYCDSVRNVKKICIEFFGEERYIAIYSNMKMIDKEKHILYFYETNLTDKEIIFICNDEFECTIIENKYGYIYDFGIKGSCNIDLKIKVENSIRTIKIN
jgi:hypothetical protein